MVHLYRLLVLLSANGCIGNVLMYRVTLCGLWFKICGLMSILFVPRAVIHNEVSLRLIIFCLFICFLNESLIFPI